MRLWHLPFLLLYAAPVMAVVSARLDRIMVRINGLDKEVGRKQRLELIRGDDLIIRYGVLEGGSRAPDILNFVGYRGEGLRRWPDDDRDIPILTSTLKKGWSLDKKGRIYKIEARTGNEIHGEILVSLLMPALESVTLSINGVEHKLKAEDTLNMAPADSIQVVDVKTNSPIVDQAVRMEFKETKSDVGRQVEVRILYRSYAFASIYLRTVNK